MPLAAAGTEHVIATAFGPAGLGLTEASLTLPCPQTHNPVARYILVARYISVYVGISVYLVYLRCAFILKMEVVL